MIPTKPSSKDAVACVGELVGGMFVGCSRTPQRFVVGIADKGLGLGQVEDADKPSVKVCGVCSRHLESLIASMRSSAPESHRTEPMVFTVKELLSVWEDFFEDLYNTLGGGEWDEDIQRR
ncbi:hypothetical protein [Arthrobacter sp. MA-N2]|uniref:hypothetical protein n=1 Tax=Arthrobacter sp. MA-N2 TaxID=1101188 RepID=UPI0004B2AC18|nr:hypothetical protein [Arthrobacter sp. MA-N2]